MAESAGRMRLTSRFCDSVKVAERTDFHDDDARGLMLRVTPSGSKSWAFTYYRPGTKDRARITFGPYPALTLADARARALEARTALARGVDPGARREAAKRVETFNDLADRYLETYARRHKRTWAQDAEMLNRDVRHRLGPMKVDTISKRDVLDLLEAIEARGAPILAQRTFEVVRGLFRWAVANDYAAADPTVSIKRRLTREARSRYLSEAEIAVFWHGLDRAGMDDRTRVILRLLLITGQRLGEVAEAERAEFDLEAAVWTIPARRSKNGREHTVPLTPMAVVMIRAAIEKASGSQFLFPSAPRSKATLPTMEQPIATRSIAKAMLRAREILGLSENAATPHDLRRSVASHMARLGISESTIGRVLNHVSEARRTITGAVYVRHSFAAEKRRALDAWAAELKSIISDREAGPNVVSLRSR